MLGFIVPPSRLAPLASVLLLAAAAGAADPAPRQGDEAQIRAAAQAYLDALGRGDGKACAALWTPDGDIVDDLGAVLPGRDTAAAATPAPAGTARPEVRISDTKVRFLTADVAMEDGTIEIGPAGAAVSGRFTATWVRHDGAWKLTALREARAAEPAGPASLGQLAWMVGDWEIERKAPAANAPLAPGASERPTMRLTVKWNDTKTFLERDLSVGPPAGASGPTMTISQRIGWEPLSRSIRSWAFGSDGSHAEGTWHRDGGSWIAHVTTVRPDGSQLGSINIYTYDGKDRCVWRSIPTHVGADHTQPMSATLVRTPGSTSR
ncbi:MAG: SgcJ/EcaC family oxidoreductase [Planctomycetaceae bacterium]